MLTKLSEIDVPQNNPFVNDKLERKVSVENLTRLVQSTNQPFVISVEAPWGWGKTTFMKICRARLEADRHTCLFFNAWENDFVEDPLIAFIGEIQKSISGNQAKGKVGTQLRKLRKIGGKIVRRGLPFAIQVATHGVLDQEAIKQTSSVIFGNSDEIAKFASQLAEEKIKEYEKDRNSLVQFRKELAEFAKSVVQSGASKAPLVFFIDELDRCRPDFAISLLERVKHIFSAEGIVFILSIDREQLEQSVKSIYGREMKSDGYLRRFIDFRLRLPMPATESFCHSLFERFHMKEVFDKRVDEADERKMLMQIFTTLAQRYELSPRVIEQCFTEINMILRTTPPSKALVPHVLAFLVAMKAHKSNVYSMLGGKLALAQVQKIMNEIRQDMDMRDRWCRTIVAIIEANILYSNVEEDERNQAFRNYEFVVENKEAVVASQDDRKYAQQVLDFKQDIEIRRYSRAIEYLISRLDAVRDIIV